MSFKYTITYTTQNRYEDWVEQADWQFLIIPESNRNQEFVITDFQNSLGLVHEFSSNAYGFKTIRVRARQKFREVSFEANFQLLKMHINPFAFDQVRNDQELFARIDTPEFRADFEPFLRKTRLTAIPESADLLYTFDRDQSLFDNLKGLNEWTYIHLNFQPGTTHVESTLGDVLRKKRGVCQDFSHLFCALARRNGIPARYVSGYLHQGNEFFGDSQMHAWAEALIPEVGWIGFDPTNNILADHHHVKIAHGKDYADCAPLKGIIHTRGGNKTEHSVVVSAEEEEVREQQQEQRQQQRQQQQQRQ